MVCRRTRDSIYNLPQGVQSQLRALKYNKTWALTLNRGTNITKYGGTRDIVIDGTIAASRLLDHLVDRGLIGPGSSMCERAGKGTTDSTRRSQKGRPDHSATASHATVAF
jgi:hypothetical protein